MKQLQMRSLSPLLLLFALLSAAICTYAQSPGAPWLSVSTLPSAASAVLAQPYRWTGATTANTCPSAGAGGSGGSAVAGCITLDGTSWTFVGGVPNPSSATLGGVQSKAPVTHNFMTGISTSGVPTLGQPACADLSDAGPACNSGLNSAVNYSSSGRALGTIYQNTGTKPLYVSVTAHTSIGDQLHALIDNFTPPTDLIASQGAPTGGTNVSIFFIVLPGYYYSADFFGGSKAVVFWMEWT